MTVVPPPAAQVRPGDIACVPVPGPIGIGIGIGEVIAGAPFTGHRLPAFDHTLGYAGEFSATPAGPCVAPDSKGSTGPGHYVFEAHPKGARYRKLDWPPHIYPGAVWSSGLVPLRAAQRASYRNMCTQLAGTPYSALDYVAIGAHRAHLNTRRLQAYIEASGHQICSQLQDYMYLQLGIHLFTDGRWPGYVDPWDIARLLLSLHASGRP